MADQKIRQLRAQLSLSGAAGIVLTNVDNVRYSTGFASVMDGWHLIEPIAAVLIPTESHLPVSLFLPEASLVSLVVSERAGHSVTFDQLRTYDMLNFCATARAYDAHLSLPEDLIADVEIISQRVAGECAVDIVSAIGACLADQQVDSSLMLFDDLRVANHLQSRSGQPWADGLDVMLATRAIKTADELATLRESGRVADRIMGHTVACLSEGCRWTEVEKSVARFMIDQDVDPLPGSPMLFGGSYDLVFRPDLFRTPYDQPLTLGQLAILETQGRYKDYWIDINRTAHIGAASDAYRDQYNTVLDIYETLVRRLKPGANTAEISSVDDIPATSRLSAPEKLLVVAHSVGYVPLESPVPFPGTGLHAATEGFEIKENMVISIDCLYFGSQLGPSHMENVFIVTADGAESLYHYPLSLIEVL